ncbi:agmatine deiminase family protein [Marinilabilia rubra]|uniref:Agmatine deiminase n=1 Tax=Marinilabilia rubra TaxID=2162893 RepID=A0A2U2BAR0_9BACT|nr:agmatine deiminase family protein [Marinilabilia rubra]PWE00155.1 agmatine deiminase [Marinilabilia rubra]
MINRIFPPEWAPQDAVILAWPHDNTDWAPILQEARDCFKEIIEAIARFEDVIVLLNDEKESFPINEFAKKENIHPVVCPTNDTWARDFGPLFIKEGDQHIGLDFRFNGWGLKFPADQDNLITSRLFASGIFSENTSRENKLNFVLEGGSLESDGNGTLLTTSECLMSTNRNGASSRDEVEKELKRSFGAQRVLWIDHGYLAGDDTDSHIDTLARFCDSETIAYVKCKDIDDDHFQALKKMEEQLQQLKTREGNPYNLVPLPMADPVFDDDYQLPATYANFLITNGAVLVPCYNSPKDLEVKKILEPVFPGRQIIGINCRALIKQHGSLHCVTMQIPGGVINKDIING